MLYARVGEPWDAHRRNVLRHHAPSKTRIAALRLPRFGGDLHHRRRCEVIG
jgi:hypothetical protein